MRFLAILAVALAGCGAIQQIARDAGVSEPVVQVATIVGNAACTALAVAETDPLRKAAIDAVCERDITPSAPMSPSERGELFLACAKVKDLRDNPDFPQWYRNCPSDQEAARREVSLRAYSAFVTGVRTAYPTFPGATVNAYSRAIHTNGCGVTSHLVYCNNNIYIDTDLFDNYPEDWEQVALWALFHEGGHSLQGWLQLLGDYSKNQPFRELQAGCLAGAAYAAVDADTQQVARFVSLQYNIGSSKTHGTGAERRTQGMLGATEGFDACLS